PTWITGASGGWRRARGGKMAHMRWAKRWISWGASGGSGATMESMWVMDPAAAPPAEDPPARRRRQRRHRRPGLGLAQQAAEIGQRRAQLAARDDHVDHAVIAQILGALEAVGQLLADGLLDDARTGKADEG